MSYQIVDEILDVSHTRLYKEAKFVLVAYAKHANDQTLICWPSQQTIMKISCIGNKRTIRAAIHRLKDLNFLIPTGKRHGESNRVIEYRINIAEIRKYNRGSSAPITHDEMGAVLPLDGGSSVPITDDEMGAVMHLDGGSYAPRMGAVLPPRISKGIYKGINNTVTAKNTVTYTDDFLLFWKAYPRNANKKAAFKAWQKINVGKEIILNALESHKKSEQWQKPQFIPHAATWLNNERWEDDLTQTIDGQSNDKPNQRHWI